MAAHPTRARGFDATTRANSHALRTEHPLRKQAPKLEAPDTFASGASRLSSWGERLVGCPAVSKGGERVSGGAAWCPAPRAPNRTCCLEPASLKSRLGRRAVVRCDSEMNVCIGWEPAFRSARYRPACCTAARRLRDQLRPSPIAGGPQPQCAHREQRTRATRTSPFWQPRGGSSRWRSRRSAGPSVQA